MKRAAIAVLIAGLSLGFGSAAQACSQRGQFCSYPAWAANAFEAPRDRVIGYATLPTEKPVKYYYVRKSHKWVRR